jgi:hypothetical protein
MISFNLHITSIVIGFLLGYIVVSILWIIVSSNENWDRGFGNGYKACSEYYKLKSEKTKNDEINTGTEK